MSSLGRAPSSFPPPGSAVSEMTETEKGKDRRESRVDHRLGRMALWKGLITPEQLKQALEEQQLGVKRGRKKPRRLGAILASLRHLTDDQVLALLEEQEAKIVSQEKRRADDMLLGQIL